LAGIKAIKAVARPLNNGEASRVQFQRIAWYTVIIRGGVGLTTAQLAGEEARLKISPFLVERRVKARLECWWCIDHHTVWGDLSGCLCAPEGL